MEYKVFKIFEAADFERLVKGIKVAHCMGSSPTDSSIKEDETENLSKIEDLSISEKLYCSFCNTNFEDQSQQRLHYKLDWHRYNLKRNLRDLKPVTEEKFGQLEDDVSSISGSDTESDTEDEELSSDSATKLPTSSQSNSSLAEKQVEAPNKYEELRLLATRHAKVFFENADGQVLSLYRCLLHGKKDMPESDEHLVPLALKVAANPMWAIIMLGGGHFAAGIFQGKEVLVHKTFHCYTVRARQGGTQSSRDGRSAGSHPKSAGASLRRYNEAALVQHVQEIMESWSAQLSSCGLILCRAVGHNKNVLFSGRNPPLNKTDPRLRTIPFATRRATFSEVKRVHDILASLEIYGSADSYKTAFPQSPHKRSKSHTPGRSTDNTDQNESTVNNDQSEDTTIKEVVSEDKSKMSDENTSENNGTTRRKSKPAINRAKPRKSPHRPFPGIVNAILAKSSSESDISESQLLCGGMLDENIEMSFDCLKEFEDTVPQEVKDRKRGKDKKSGKKQQKKQEVKDLFSEPVMALRSKLWAACRLGDADLLINSLQAAQPIAEEPENCDTETVNKESDDNIIRRAEFLKCLNENVGESKETLLHVAAQGGHMAIVRALMEVGCDPCVKNKKSQTPYVVSANKETRNIFRRFLADFPDKYDYTKSQIAGPLTDEMEKQMAEKRKEQRKVKKEKEKERKKEHEVKQEEEAEKQRFLNLSDREKMALAAERRILSQSAHGGSKPVMSRCFQCAIDITGKIPFEYDINRFCSMNCLKQHRMKVKKNIQHKE